MAPRAPEVPTAPRALTPRSLAVVVALCVVFTWNGAVVTDRAVAVESASPPAVLSVVGSLLRPPKSASGLSLVWSDEFTGPAGAFPSSGKWNFATGGNGWGNQETQCYTNSRQNSATNGQGQLVITARHVPGGHRCGPGTTRNRFTSARITTQNKFTVTHGRLEMRALLPGGAGAWPAFWALGAVQPNTGWPRCGEIDVMEYTGNRPTVTTSAAHIARYNGKHWYTNRVSAPSKTLTTQFHVYAVEWTGASMTFYRDKTVVGTVTRAEVVKYGVWPFDKPFYLLLNLAMGGTYAGAVPKKLTSPQRFVVDYVRVYH